MLHPSSPNRQISEDSLKVNEGEGEGVNWQRHLVISRVVGGMG